jgi:hypothetical protein
MDMDTNTKTPLVLDASKTILDKEPSEWVVRWWQSLFYPNWRRALSPVYMIPGKFHNPNDVYMSRTEDEIKKDSKHYKINHNKILLLSPINWISNGVPEKEAKMREETKYEIDIIDPKIINITLDNQTQLGQQCTRISTPMFKIFRLNKYVTVSDGYWLFLQLPKGEHTIGCFGSCRSGKIQITMNYDLNIT